MRIQWVESKRIKEDKGENTNLKKADSSILILDEANFKK